MNSFFLRALLYTFLLLPAAASVQAQNSSKTGSVAFQDLFQSYETYVKKGISLSDYKKDTLTQLFDFNWRKSGKIGSYFYTVAYRTAEGWVAEDYDVISKKIANYIIYANPELTILDGVFFSFYANGNTRFSGQYRNNNKEGPWQLYYDNERLLDSTYYLHSVPVGKSYSFYPSGKTRQISIYDTLGNGTGTYTGYTEAGAVNQTGLYTKGLLKDSTWVYYFPDGKVSFLEEFRQGICIGIRCFNEDGSPRDTCTISTLPEFPGGTEAMMKYISKNISWPGGLSAEEVSSARVVAQFIVSKDGTTKGITIIRSASRSFDNQVIRAIENMPRWKPGKQYHEPIDTYYTLPVTFRRND